MKHSRLAIAAAAAIVCIAAYAQPPGRRADSPAATPVPATATPQEYAPELIEAGGTAFASNCGFCHGIDAAGGSGGPDLTRSELVAADFRGDEIGPVVRDGRLEASVPMPAFPVLSDRDLESIVAFIHNQKTILESAEGGRQSVSTEDVLTGDVTAGQRYFEDKCVACHDAEGDLSGIASRMSGLNLMRRMLVPGGGRDSSGRSIPRVTLRTAEGESHVGLLDYQDEFVIVLTDAAGRYRSFATHLVEFEIDDPLAEHMTLLEQYTDEDMHDVLAYLHTLRQD